MTKNLVRGQTVAIASVAALAISMGAGATAAMASADGNPIAMSAILATEQTAEDLLPPEDGGPFAAGLGLVPESSRSLGDTDTVRNWIVLDQDANVCLVAQFISDGWSTITCTTPEDFQKVGLSSMQLSDSGDYAESYLVPDGLQAQELPAGLDQLESGLITGDTRATDGALTFSGGDGARGRISEQIEIRLLHPVDSIK